MKKQKENNGLYVENPTVGYQEAQEQPTYDRKVEPYNRKEESNSNNNNDDDFYGEMDDAYNEEEIDANEEESYYDEEEIYDEKADTKIKKIRAYSNPYTVGGTLFVFWPLGLYWMWKYKVYKKRTRIILSVLMPVYGTLRWIGRFSN
ncbi:hypothetical protein [Clostridium lacusfryxellense]|uniref:hypothetical protein n=1 Tax=Clostridium lacusfryxellense TaxID=205328 RepID=UPI001C0B1447|nr:hypothetical protein [Clostridium lacusfryxellense]MBU3114072.1 hypothetical protein [Clostridium lacusfryxellense]